MIRAFVLAWILATAALGCDSRSAPTSGRKDEQQDLERVDLLVKLLASPRFDERERATRELLELRVASLDALRRVLNDKDLERAKRARRCLEVIQRDMTVAECAEDLRSFSSEARQQAAEKLLRFGEAARTAVPALAAALRDPDPAMRDYVLYVLRELAPVAEAAIPSIVEFLRNETMEPASRARAAVTLAHFGWRHDQVLPVLFEQAQARDPAVRRGVAHALGLVQSKDPDIFGELFRLLGDEDPVVHAIAGLSLERRGKSYEQQITTICNRLMAARARPKEAEAGRRLLRALGHWGSWDVNTVRSVPVVLDIVADDKAPIALRLDGVRTLELMGSRAREALRDLAHVKHPEVATRVRAVLAKPIERPKPEKTGMRDLTSREKK